MNGVELMVGFLFMIAQIPIRVANQPVDPPDRTIQILTLIAGILSTFGTAFISYLVARLNADQKERSVRIEEVAKEAAVKVEIVKDDLAKSVAMRDRKLKGLKNVTNGLAVTAEATHTLVNSNFGEQLFINKTLARQVASMTSDPIAKKEADRVADLADEKYQDHQAGQKFVDDQQGSDAEKKGQTEGTASATQ